MTGANAIGKLPLSSPVVFGFGVTGKAVAAALVSRGFTPVVVDDRVGDGNQAKAAELGVDLIEAPTESQLAAVVEAASAVLPSPGVPDHHPLFAAAKSKQIPILSEFDLAQDWDDRPVVAITGTNGKTSVTMIVTDVLIAAGIKAVAVGNTDVPLVAAISDVETEMFVVEASSFRLAHSQRFRPQIAAWINFAPDHLDAHATLEDYEQAKASVWSNLEPAGNIGAMAIGNADDPVVHGHLVSLADSTANGDVSIQTFSIAGLDQSVSSSVGSADWYVAGSDSGSLELVGPDGPLIAVSALQRRQPHDVSNALAVAAIAAAAGASRSAIAETLASFAGLAHRLELLGSNDDVSWYNDSKATVPHATVAAVGGFESVVLIAGGRNKGLDMTPLSATVPPVRAVVATGDAADEIESVYDGLVPVERAESMVDAVQRARRLAESGDAVLLSPACTSYDWYSSYVKRGEDFSQIVRQEVLK